MIEGTEEEKYKEGRDKEGKYRYCLVVNKVTVTNSPHEVAVNVECKNEESQGLQTEDEAPSAKKSCKHFM